MNMSQFEARVISVLEQILDRMPPHRAEPEVSMRAGDVEDCTGQRSGEEVPPGYPVGSSADGEPAGDIMHPYVFHSLTPGRCGYGERGELCGATRSAHSPLAERRQVLVDLMNHPLHHWSLPERERVAEGALRVRMTPTIVEPVSALLHEEHGVQDHETARRIARAVLTAAGFEVTQ